MLRKVKCKVVLVFSTILAPVFTLVRVETWTVSKLGPKYAFQSVLQNMGILNYNDQIYKFPNFLAVDFAPKQIIF